MRLLALATLLAAPILAGCGTATIDEAFGRPDATEWTYFEGPAQEVLVAIRQFYSARGVATESARDEAGGVILTLAVASGSADVGQILVQATNVEGFESRAQIYPTRRPLPQALETDITRRF